METENKPTVGTLNEKILDILDDKIYSVDNIICKHSVKGQEQAANSIEQLILEEVGKAWDAGAIKECYTHSHWDIDEKPPTKEEYITSLTKK